MTTDRAADALWIVGAIILVGSALIARRRSASRPTLTMTFAWLAIFTLLFAIAHWLDSGG